MLEEVARGDAGEEVRLGDEVVVDAVLCEEGEGEEGAGKGGSSSVPAEERRVVFRSSIESSSSLLFEVCACLFRRTHPLAEVAVE